MFDPRDCVQVSQLRHVVSVKDALLEIYSRATDEQETPATYVPSRLHMFSCINSAF